MDVEAILDAVCAQRGTSAITLPQATCVLQDLGLAPSQPDNRPLAQQQNPTQVPQVPAVVPSGVGRAAGGVVSGPPLDDEPVQVTDRCGSEPLPKRVRTRRHVRKPRLGEARELLGHATCIPPDGEPVKGNGPHTAVPLRRSTRIRTPRVRKSAVFPAAQTITANGSQTQAHCGSKQKRKFAHILDLVKRVEYIRDENARREFDRDLTDKVDKFDQEIRELLRRLCRSCLAAITELVQAHPEVWKYMEGSMLRYLKQPNTSVKEEASSLMGESFPALHHSQPNVEQGPALSADYLDMYIKKEPEDDIEARTSLAVPRTETQSHPPSTFIKEEKSNPVGEYSFATEQSQPDIEQAPAANVNYLDICIKKEPEDKVETQTSTAAPRTETQSHSTDQAPAIPRFATISRVLAYKRTPSVGRRQPTPRARRHQRIPSVGRRYDRHDSMNFAAQAGPSASREY